MIFCYQIRLASGDAISKAKAIRQGKNPKLSLYHVGSVTVHVVTVELVSFVYTKSNSYA
jgi:hypothetical protein